MSNGNTILHAPDRPTPSAVQVAGGIGIASAAGTAAAACVMVQMAPDPSVAPAVAELLKQQQLAVAGLVNVGVTTIVAALVNVARNWLYSRDAGK